MTWHHFIAEFAHHNRLNHAEAHALLKSAFGLIDAAAKTGRLSIPGHGVYYRKSSKARRILNPQTKKPMRIPAQETVGFRAAKALKRKRGKK